MGMMRKWEWSGKEGEVKEKGGGVHLNELYLPLLVTTSDISIPRGKLTLNTVPLTNEWGLSIGWNTGGDDPMTRHRPAKIAAPVMPSITCLTIRVRHCCC